jgi:tripartite-type tricarboxylate transporter receptor subunit TctC
MPMRDACGKRAVPQVFGESAMHRLILAIAVLAVAGGGAGAAEPEFYQGKVITIIVGYGVGGGYDIYARLLTRHMAEHIPSHPSIIVENMPGAAGVRAANNVYGAAPKDGTVIAALNPSLLMYQLLGGQFARYETAKLQWIGSLDDPNNSIITWHSAGIHSIADAKTREVPMAGDGPTAALNIYPTATNALVGTRFKMINGYTGSAAGDLAMERGEVDGRSGASLSSLFSQHADWIRDGKIDILLQFGVKRDPALPAVPLLQELATTDRDRQIAAVVSLPTTVGPAYWMAPGVPQEALRIVREAFDATVADPQFLADAKAIKLAINPKSGAEVAAAVNAVSNVPPDVLAQTAAILGW